MITDIERFESSVELHVLPPLCPLDVSPADFSRSRELFYRSFHATEQWLDTSHHTVGQSRSLGLHQH
jgi:NTE family protein